MGVSVWWSLCPGLEGPYLGGGGFLSRGSLSGGWRVSVWGSLSRGKPLPPVDRMTDASKNITLPHTSFAGGKNVLQTR